MTNAMNCPMSKNIGNHFVIILLFFVEIIS